MCCPACALPAACPWRLLPVWKEQVLPLAGFDAVPDAINGPQPHCHLIASANAALGCSGHGVNTEVHRPLAINNRPLRTSCRQPQPWPPHAHLLLCPDAGEDVAGPRGGKCMLLNFAQLLLKLAWLLWLLWPPGPLPLLVPVLP